jgi:hypothetical protein
VTIVDANVLLFAVDETSPFHSAAKTWLTDRLNGPARVGLPWPSLLAFLRISTHPRAAQHPLRPQEAWDQVESWLSSDAAWVPQPTELHATVLKRLVTTYEVRGNLIVDAHLAALAFEHGVAVASADTDFARFTEIEWENPVATRS